ncbi:MAG TPA: GNAT family N-acetyltransferase [Phycisphaerae bacterium]|nr:GNAT family N-acetyltransferase [Phycisphaerae bacterium]HRW55343.1 GNAT family N-acetyltransferase [Phycisphaerae bacterium]
MANAPTPAINVQLRPVVADDLPTLHAHQLDPDANAMAAVRPRDEAAFRSVLETAMQSDGVTLRAILADDELVGQITIFRLHGQDAVGYWIAKEHWGREIATRALQLLLDEVSTRPLVARVATHNAASIRVLEKCGFVVTGREHSPGTERYVECEETVLRLE